MQFAAFFGLHHAGWLVYHVVIVVAVHIAAYLSWHLIEKPAMSLKNWTPIWLQRLYDSTLTPAWERLMGRVVDPRFSSTPRAARMREAAPEGAAT